MFTTPDEPVASPGQIVSRGPSGPCKRTKKHKKMSKKRFRLSEKDTVNATLSGERKLLASLYDSGFHSIDQVFRALCQKVPYYAGKVVEVNISANDGEKWTSFTRKVNK
jgi:hypothetical protein